MLGAPLAESIAMTTDTIARASKTVDLASIDRHVITVRETSDRHGRFEIILADGSALPASRTPILSSARHLIGEGANPAATIEMRHASTPGAVAMSGRLGAAAKLEVREDRSDGPAFVKWRPDRFKNLIDE
jgi:hypothetical protein